MTNDCVASISSPSAAPWRPSSQPVDPSKIAVLRKRVGDGETVASVCRDLMLSRSAAYEYLSGRPHGSPPQVV